MSLSSATHKSYRKLGVHLTRQLPPSPKKPDSIVDAIRKRLRFPKNPRSDTISDGDDDDDGEDHIVWDEPNPFGPPDPTLAHLRVLINAEIARTRRYESIGPFDPVDDDNDYYDDDSDSDSDDSDSDGHVADDEDSVSDHDDWVANVRGRDVDCDDRDDRVANVRDNDYEDNEPAPILLPRLLSVPLRFIPSPPSPSPSPSYKYLSTPWADDEDNVSDHDDRVANVRGRDVDYDDRDDRVANVRDNDYEDNEPAPILLPRLVSVPLRFIPSPPSPSPSPSDKYLSIPWADDEDNVSDHDDRVANVRGRDVDYDDHDDRVANVRDNDYEDNEPAPILLPRLLSVPLRFIPSPPPPSPSRSDKDLSTPWADLARVYNDIAEAHERAAHKAKRDAHCSHSKALGPEASSAL